MISQTFPVKAELLTIDAVSGESLDNLSKRIARDIQKYAQKKGYKYFLSVTAANEEDEKGSYICIKTLYLEREFQEARHFDSLEMSLECFIQEMETKGLIKLIS